MTRVYSPLSADAAAGSAGILTPEVPPSQAEIIKTRQRIGNTRFMYNEVPQIQSI